jgi:signal transduction histidine kinase
VVALSLVRPLGALSRSLVRGLLGANGEELRPPAAARAARRRWLAVHASAFAFLTLLTTLIWALTTRSYYWPVWVILGLGVPLAIHAWVELVDARPELVRAVRGTRALAIVAGVAGVLSLLVVWIWAITSRGYFWPVWPIIGFAVVLGAHAAVVAVDTRRNGPLSERIAALETTRAGAVDQQETELRRIERDLHDGAQARLVALGMSIGMAEQKLASDPAGAQQLLAEARRGAREALEELRDLARGIHPPVLADRGLEAAISALANRTPLHVRVMIDVDKRPPAPVETAAYFVVAEALANTGKHARAEHVDIAVRRRGGTLVVEVVDAGVGGADRSGSGLGGLARRVEALDGSFEVASPPGGPTTVRAVLPCGS